MTRRRKGGSTRKHSLVFQESPVDERQCKRLLSPVLCVDHPVTALSVPVDETIISWVSPQFNGIAVSHGKRRQARRRRHSAGGKHVEVTSNKENSHVNRSHSRSGSITRKKYAALDFVGDKPKSATRLRPNRSAVLGLVSTNCRSERVSNATEDNEAGAELQNNTVHDNEGEGGYFGRKETLRKRRSSCRKSVRLRHRPSVMPSASFCGDDSASSLPSPNLTGERRNSTNNQHDFTTLRGRPNISKCEDGDQNLSVNQGSRRLRTNRKSYDSEILVSPLEVSSVSQLEGDSTPVNLGVRGQLPLRVALFAPSPSEGFLDNSGCNCPEKLGNGQETAMDSNSASPLPGDRSTSGTKNGSKQRCSSSQRCFSQDTSERSTPRRSKRLQEKCAEAMRYLRPGTPVSRRSSVVTERCLNILVHDTPESEYGLTFRQKQQMIIKNKMF